MNLKFSIIVATYNSQSNIKTCLQSILKQTHQQIELVIIDGGSTDGTLQEIQCSGIKPDILVSEPDNGIYDALNKGLSKATGDVIGFVHSDDFLTSTDVLASISECFLEQKVDGVYGDLQYVHRDNTNLIVRHWKSRPFNTSLLKRGWMPAHPTLYLRRGVYEKHGRFDMSLRIAADYDFIVRVMSDNELAFAYLSKVLVKMRLGGASNRNFKNLVQKSKEDYYVLRKNKVGGLYTLLCKNLLKLPQFILR
ncbi:glycosyltransferase family 2 protein [Legionella impletisoli]|uniref:glycosyltransferase family 2 protein n=1 Tax=Legionella impletisoli TaxID=343510 RepID=UPI001A94682B|nr:glycosyltransferase family 2 protein [Legionella impletisoli]